jgi:competence protein ComEC
MVFGLDLRWFYSAITAERRHFFVWLVSFFLFGVAVYFLIPFEPFLGRATNLYLCAIMLMVFYFMTRKNAAALIVIAVFSGFLWAAFRGENLAKKNISVLEIPKTPLLITAQITSLELQEHGIRILLEGSETAGYKLPEKIRITVRAAHNNVEIGDWVKLRAVLLPLAAPAMPGSYEFRRAFFWQGISMTGYAVSALKKLDQPLYPTSWWRKSFFEISQWGVFVSRFLIEKSVDTDHGRIAAAFLLGAQGAIPRDLYELMRDSGLAHLVAISGMNMVVVAGLIFFVLRFFLVLIPGFAERYNSKKIAAFFALLTLSIYVLMVGAPFSAVRAFLMTALVLLAVLYDRLSQALYAAALVAFLMIIYQPASLLNAGFQMSFAATLALIRVFSWIQKFFKFSLLEQNSYRMILISPLMVFATTLVATIATAPFSIYHFHNFSLSGVFANLLVAPIASLWMTPLGLFGLALAPFGFSDWPLFGLELGISMMIKIARWCTEFSWAVLNIPSIPAWSWYIIVAAECICFIAYTKFFRIFSTVIILLILLSIPFFRNPPVLLIGEKAKLFAYEDISGNWRFSNLRSEKFMRRMWQQSLGIADNAKLLLAESDTKNLGFLVIENSECPKNIKLPLLVWLAQTQAEAQENCPQFFSYLNTALQTKHIFQSDLEENGTYAVFRDKSGFTLKHSKGAEGRRFWNYWHF